jgi:hypothetical protein
METEAQLKALDGTTGTENIFVWGNAYLNQYEVKEMREQLASNPRLLARFNREIIPVVHTWTYKFGYSRFGNMPAVYRTNETYTEAPHVQA